MGRPTEGQTNTIAGQLKDRQENIMGRLTEGQTEHYGQAN